MIDDPVFWDRVLLSQHCSSLTENKKDGRRTQTIETMASNSETPSVQEAVETVAKEVCPISGVKREQEAHTPVGINNCFKRYKSQ